MFKVYKELENGDLQLHAEAERKVDALQAACLISSQGGVVRIETTNGPYTSVFMELLGQTVFFCVVNLQDSVVVEIIGDIMPVEGHVDVANLVPLPQVGDIYDAYTGVFSTPAVEAPRPWYRFW